MEENIPNITRTPLEASLVEIPSPRQQYNIQRRGARVPLPPGTTARLQFWDVALINLSLSGALIEHSQRVRVGDLYFLSFKVQGQSIRVKARTVRSFVSHRVQATGDDPQLFYRTGVEFVGLSSDTTKLIAAYLERLRASKLDS